MAVRKGAAVEALGTTGVKGLERLQGRVNGKRSAPLLSTLSNTKLTSLVRCRDVFVVVAVAVVVVSRSRLGTTGGEIGRIRQGAPR